MGAPTNAAKPRRLSLRRCCICGALKPEEAFAFRNQATGRRQSHCRVCHAAYRRQHYLANRQDYIDREIARMRGYRDQNRKYLVDYLKEHPCVDCGETDPLFLEFDHRERATKTGVIALLAPRKPWHRVIAEISKCDIRCVSCHRQRTARQMKWHKALPVQLLIEDDGASPAISTIEASTSAIDETSRRCRLCGVVKPANEFSYRNKSRGTRKRRCKKCVATNSREHYKRNPGPYKTRAHTKRDRNRRSQRDRVIQYLLSHACIDCGETNPILLEFDHREPAAKTKSVGALLANSTWTKISREIAKCDVRCVRCHRRRTAEQFGWKKLIAAYER